MKETQMKRYLRPVVLAFALSLATGSAFAHAHPKVMEPGVGFVGAAPAQVSIRFTEGLEPKFSSIQVSGADGAAVTKAASVVDAGDATHMTLALPALRQGSYSVHWIAVATDGHRTEGTYSFTVR
jgi:methionine-rich copper-binding protein CopC